MKNITVRDLADALKAGSRVVIDVREDWELEQCALPDALHLPLSRFVQSYADKLSPDTRYACLCHHGMRSAQAARYLSEQGFSDVVNVEGGIDAWAALIDPEMARY